MESSYDDDDGFLLDEHETWLKGGRLDDEWIARFEEDRAKAETEDEMGNRSLLVLLMWASMVITTVGNVLVLISILTQPKLRNCRSNRFLINLAIADFNVGLFVMVPSILKYDSHRWNYGADICMLWVTMDVGFCSASIYSLLGISVDRLYAVYLPHRYVSHRKNILTTNLLLLLAWTM